LPAFHPSAFSSSSPPPLDSCLPACCLSALSLARLLPTHEQEVRNAGELGEPLRALTLLFGCIGLAELTQDESGLDESAHVVLERAVPADDCRAEGRGDVAVPRRPLQVSIDGEMQE